MELPLAFVPGTSENRIRCCVRPVGSSPTCGRAVKGAAVLPRTHFSPAAGSPLNTENAMQKDSLGLGDPAQFFIVTAKRESGSGEEGR